MRTKSQNIQLLDKYILHTQFYCHIDTIHTQSNIYNLQNAIVLPMYIKIYINVIRRIQ